MPLVKNESILISLLFFLAGFYNTKEAASDAGRSVNHTLLSGEGNNPKREIGGKNVVFIFGLVARSFCMELMKN